MKKLFALLLILAICVSVCAFTVSCIGGDNNQNSGSGTQNPGDNPDDGDPETPGDDGGNGNQGGGSTNDGPPTGTWLPID